MSQFFVNKTQIQPPHIFIQGTDVHHIHYVLRKKEKDSIQITCKQTQKKYLCAITQITPEQITCHILQEQEENKELPFSITIYQGLPKAEKMEWMIQKCTELGVTQIVPTIMQNCVVQSQEKKIERWQKIAEVAAKQCGRNRIPTITMPQTISQILPQIANYDIVLLAYEKETSTTLKQVLQTTPNAQNIAIMIGPEGGLQETEVQALEKQGAKVVTLGKRILRTETVAIVMVSNIIYEKEP